MERGFIYLWFDRKHRRFYLGRHWGEPDDGYVCSSSWMKQAYSRRPQDFKRRIIHWCSSKQELAEAEKAWGELVRGDELGARYYNLRKPGEDGHWHGDPKKKITVGQKISKINTGKKRTEETKLRMSKAWENRGPISLETKQKISNTLTGQVQSEETRLKRAKTLKGRPKPIVQCPHCEKVGGKSAMMRWHFEACKNANRTL